MENYSDEKWIGKKFNSLTVVDVTKRYRKAGKYMKPRNYWVCQCDCGGMTIADPIKVISGHTKTCGCGKLKRLIEYNHEAKTKHGGRHDRLYKVWRGMKSRCCCETNKDYDKYGGRGITICDEWINDYAAFRNWAMENGYSEDLTIDRIDVNGNYEPSNCRWADYTVQARNQRRIKKYDFNGGMKCLTEVAQEIGVPFGTLYARIFHRGWTFEEAVNGKRNSA